MNADTFFERIRGGLIVSCQALPNEPLHGPAFMVGMAQAAASVGAVGIRANSPVDIRAIADAVSLPLIGLDKHGSEEVFITPSPDHARGVARAGAHMVAMDATCRRDDLRESFDAVLEEGALIMADIATVADAEAALAAGCHCVSTTLSGYTDDSPQQTEPDLELVAKLRATLAIPVIAEGRYNTPELARAALDAGAFAVVVGSAITRPQLIAANFVAAMECRLG